MIKKCIHPGCNETISEGRLKAVPGTDYCVKHSPVQKYKTDLFFAGKQGGYLIIQGSNFKPIGETRRNMG